MPPKNPPKYLKYLPSKKFAKVFGLCIGGILVIFIITSRFGTSNAFNRNISVKAPLAPTGTVSDLVNRDSNNNGIPDWEETLYGLDPTADGAANKKIIEEKEAGSAASSTTVNDSPIPTSATDAFSQQVLSTLLALQQSGTLNTESITNLADSIGTSVDAKHANAATYSIADQHIIQNETPAQKTAYAAALKGIIDQYANVDLGSELSIIADGMGGGGASTLTELAPIAAAYTGISQQIIALDTPSRAAPFALELANTSAEMGVTLVSVANLYNDVLTGMVGLDDYIKASDANQKATDDMRAYLDS